MEINEFNRAVITQEITHERAEQAALRIISGAFNRTDKRPQFSIPVRPDDDDIILMEYLRRQKSPWRDIESAPKDGTKFLAWFTWPGRHSVEMARWQSNQYAKQPKPYWTCDNERLHGIIATRAAQPTHWMPLPEPPR